MGIKKERRLAPPLRVEVSELRLRKTADLPRPSQLRSVLSALPLGSDRGPSTPALFIDVFWLPASRACACSAAGLPGSHPFRRPVPLRLAPSLPPGPSRAEAPSGPPTLLQPKLFPVAWLPAARAAFRPGPLEAFASWRLSPGIASPFRVAPLGTTGALQSPVRATCSGPREH